MTEKTYSFPMGSALKKGMPWMLGLSALLLIGKFGFALGIPFLWALSPLWMPVLVALGLYAAFWCVIALAILVTGLVVGTVAVVSELVKGARRRRMLKKAKLA